MLRLMTLWINNAGKQVRQQGAKAVVVALWVAKHLATNASAFCEQL